MERNTLTRTVRRLLLSRPDRRPGGTPVAPRTPAGAPHH
jgi:hypothetical protein